MWLIGGRINARFLVSWPNQTIVLKDEANGKASLQRVSVSMLCFPKWISNFYLPLCHMYWSNISWAIKCQQNCPRPRRRYKYEEDKIPAHKQLTSRREMITCLQLRINRRNLSRNREGEQRREQVNSIGKVGDTSAKTLGNAVQTRNTGPRPKGRTRLWIGREKKKRNLCWVTETQLGRQEHIKDTRKKNSSVQYEVMIGKNFD